MLRALLATLLILPSAALAQDRIPSHCIALADHTQGIEYLHKAAFTDAVQDETIRLRYIDHASFLLQTAGGLSVVTDYTGYLGDVDFVPTVVTMNHAHSSHWTSMPDARVPHILPGWNADGGPIYHHVDLGEMLVRNVSTDIRGYGGIEEAGNSIFIFEVAGLCVGHLGHLHHEPTPEQFAAIGRLDVVIAAVDGGYTVDLPTMIRTLKRFRSSIIIPMHWFGTGTLDAFLTGMMDEFAIVRAGSSELEVSLSSLPDRPTVVVLEPRYLSSTEADQ
ncbi:MBL fold metallo-hydrolase [Qingshengfaniella alkalisoli]|uniref:MBL fold metallo-hydrolase n=1 Tax=Qingshengfaniella alkalisoli TaxID=2599296 RepID=A0A5B8J5B2_9RHOB|nr:MBL fold metallo-hydrolase [Qingshengfaniella alkalisoli]QDY69510.1 MBL fold metallo-hydrolase [Qingshengfaniella alkalisoli]